MKATIKYFCFHLNNESVNTKNMEHSSSKKIQQNNKISILLCNKEGKASENNKPWYRLSSEQEDNRLRYELLCRTRGEKPI